VLSQKNHQSPAKNPFRKRDQFFPQKESRSVLDLLSCVRAEVPYIFRKRALYLPSKEPYIFRKGALCLSPKWPVISCKRAIYLLQKSRISPAKRRIFPAEEKTPYMNIEFIDIRIYVCINSIFIYGVLVCGQEYVSSKKPCTSCQSDPHKHTCACR